MLLWIPPGCLLRSDGWGATLKASQVLGVRLPLWALTSNLMMWSCLGGSPQGLQGNRCWVAALGAHWGACQVLEVGVPLGGSWGTCLILEVGVLLCRSTGCWRVGHCFGGLLRFEGVGNHLGECVLACVGTLGWAGPLRMPGLASIYQVNRVWALVLPSTSRLG